MKEPVKFARALHRDSVPLNRYTFIGYRNNRYFPHINPYKYANRSSHVAMQRQTYKELLTYQAWATCARPAFKTVMVVSNLEPKGLLIKD